MPDAVTDVGERLEEDTSITLDLLANDTDADGDVLNITQIDGQTVTVGEPIIIDNGTVTVGADGRVTFTPTVDYVGVANFTYTISDGEGGSDTANVSLEVFADTTPPAAPEVNPPTQTPEGELTVTGTSEPGGTIKVTFGDGSTVEVPVGDDGTWTATSATPQTSGDVSVIACDDDGNPGPETEITFVDEQPPQPPVITSIDQNPDGEITVTGTGEPGSTITICFPDGDKVDVIVGTDGEFEVTSTTPQQTGEISLTQTDEAGNESEAETQDYVDDQAPEPPVINEITTGGDGLVSVTGTAEPGSTVTVNFPDGTIGTVVAGPDGSWTVTSEAPQTNGTVTATSTDVSGNVSTPDDAPYADQVIDRPIFPQSGDGFRAGFDADESDGGFGVKGNGADTARDRAGRSVTDGWLGDLFAESERMNESLSSLMRSAADAGYRGGTLLSQVPGGECGLIQVESVASGRDLVIGFSHVANAGCNVGVRSWSVEGAELVGPDAIILQRYEGADTRNITIRARMENGQVVRVPVQVDLTTGRLTRTGQTAMGLMTLDMQLAELDEQSQRTDPVVQALAG